MTLKAEERSAIAEAQEQEHRTRRPTVAALEEVLYQPMEVLDHGFVRVVDYMGDDEAIVQAARVSYGRGTSKLRDDRGLIRYLIRHRHTTPLEMCEIKLHVKLPIFVARQWIRHRTACIAGDSELVFDLPGAGRRGRRQSHRVRIEKLHRLWHEGTQHPVPKKKATFSERIEAERLYTIAELAREVERRPEDLRSLIRAGKLPALRDLSCTGSAPQLRVRGQDWLAYAALVPLVRTQMRPRLARMQLRMCDEESGEIRHTQIQDIWQSGVKPVFRVTLQNGYTLKMTKDHRCLTESGWLTLEQATGLRLGAEGGVTWRSDAPAFAVNGIPAHRDRAWLAARKEEGNDLAQIAKMAAVSTHTVRKSLKAFGLSYTAATTQHAQQVHARNGYHCVLCTGRTRLHAHHIDPVWHNPDRAQDLDNLISLCASCHTEIHRQNLELELLAACQGQGMQVVDFWRARERRPRPAQKRLPPPRRLVRTYSPVAKIEFAGEEMTYDLEVSGPCHNFVANGFIVHNSVNEYSARYSILDREFYLPRIEDLGAQSMTNRQGRKDALPAARADEVLRLLREDALRCYDHYLYMLNEDEAGAPLREGEPPLARELARMDLTLNYYTQWYWKIDLHNLLHFLHLRMDPHAQMEIRAYADAISALAARWVPHAWEAFVDYRQQAVSLSRQELLAVRALLRGERPDLDALGLSRREQAELQQKLDLPLSPPHSR